MWIFRDHGQVRHIRVVGHANEEVCEQVSESLLMAVADPAVDGFLTFGVADLKPASDVVRFAQVVTPVVEDIHRLAETDLGKQYVRLHEVTQDFDDTLPETRVPDRLKFSVAVAAQT